MLPLDKPLKLRLLSLSVPDLKPNAAGSQAFNACHTTTSISLQNLAFSSKLD